MINWTYNKNDFKINENANALIPEGDHRVVVRRVTVKTYSSGNEGFEIMLDVSGYPGKLWHRIIIDPSTPEKTNHHIGKFLESFNITDYDLNRYEDWVGKDGAVRVRHESYEGTVSAKVIFCITRAYQAKLPAWREPDGAKVYESTKAKQVGTTQPFDNVPAMPNEFVPPVHKREMNFDGFLF